MKFGSSKPVSEQELVQARACLKLLKKRMAVDPPTYFTQNTPPDPSSNYRKVFKPEAKLTPPPAPQAPQPTRPPIKKPNNVAIDSSKGFSQYNFEGVEGANPDEPDERRECPDCNRKFLPESYEKHVNICKKVFLSKRKAFNSSEQREIDEATISKKKPEPKKNAKSSASASAKANKWKIESEQFRANMRAARMATSGDEAGYQEAAKIASDYAQSQLVPCPTCERTFNEEAAKRHIPICANKARMSQMKHGNKPTAKGKK